VDSTAAYLVSQMATPEGQVTFGFFMGKDTLKDGFTRVTRSAITVAGPLCVASEGVAGAGECFEFTGGSTDVSSEQALSYMNNLIG